MSKEKWADDLFGEPSELEEAKATSDEQKEELVSLETGLQHLEAIVKTLEQKDLPLEKALNLFKEGVGLVQYCSKCVE
ncbi:MAG TPA: exodeoxyribonuclease VII small subunit [Desulfosporosinus sp.]